VGVGGEYPIGHLLKKVSGRGSAFVKAMLRLGQYVVHNKLIGFLLADDTLHDPTYYTSVGDGAEVFGVGA